mgnify:CR=1 FL=1
MYACTYYVYVYVYVYVYAPGVGIRPISFSGERCGSIEKLFTPRLVDMVRSPILANTHAVWMEINVIEW